MQNIELVPKEDLDRLSQLDTQLASLSKSTLELAASLVEMNKELSKSGVSIKELKKTEKDLNTIEKECIKLNTESSKLEQQKQRYIERNTSAYKKLHTETEKERLTAQKSAKQTKATARAAAATAGSIEELRAKVIKLKLEWANMSRTDPGFKAKTKELKSMTKELMGAEKSANIFGRSVGNYPKTMGSLKSLGGMFGVGMGVSAAVGILKNATKTIVEFEQANANLATILGKSQSEITGLTNSAKKLGATTEWAASQVTELQTELAKLGFSEQDISKMQASILQFATAMGANLSDAAALAGSTLRAFGLDASETDRIAGVMAVGANKSALSFEYLNTAMSTISPVAKAFGFGIEDTVALLGTLSDAGFDASTAATATRNILLNLADANGKLAKQLGGPVKTIPELSAALKTLRDRGVNLNDTLELTDKRSVAAFNTFIDGADTLVSLRGELEDVGGELERIQKERLNTTAGSTKLLKSAWESLMLSFSNSSGFMKGVVDGLTSMVNGINSIINNTRVTVEEIDKEVKAFVDLEDSLTSLVGEYTTLTKKTDLNADEQARLSTIISQLAKQVPQAIAGFNEYGTVLDINTDKVYEYLDAERARLEFMNRKVIKSTEKYIRKQQEELFSLKNIYKGGTKTGVNTSPYLAGPSAPSKLTTEEFAKLADRIAEVGHNLFGAEKELERLNGTTLKKSIEAAKALRSQRIIFNAMNEEDLKSWLADEANAANEYFKIAQEIHDFRFKIEDSGKGLKNNGTQVESKAQERLAAQEADANQKSMELVVQIRANANQRIMNDTKANFSERLTALKEYEKAQKDIIERSAEYQKKKLVEGLIADKDNDIKTEAQAEERAQNQILYILQAAADKKAGITINGEAARTTIVQEEAKRRIKAIADEAEQAATKTEQGEQQKLLNLSQAYKKGIISTQEYEDKKKELARETQQEIFEEQIRMLEAQLELEDLSTEERAEIQRKINAARAAFAKINNQQIIDDNKSAAEKQLEADKRLSDARKQLAAELFNFIGGLIDANTKKQLDALDKEMEQYNEFHDEKLRQIETLEEGGAISTEQANARKALAEQELREKEKEIEKEKEEVEKRQFYAKQAMAVGEIIMNTAVAVMAAWRNPWAAPILVPMIIATGAVQLGTVLAQTIAAYAEGTDNHPGGLAIVGDGGRSEAVIHGGNIYKTPDVPTLVDLPKGAQVLPDWNQLALSMMLKPIGGEQAESRIAAAYNDANVVNGILQGNRSIDKFMHSFNREKKNKSYYRFFKTN